MEIKLSGIGKQFNLDWIFRNIDFEFPSGSASVITGRNGSGKSTLLQVIAGNMAPTRGEISYINGIKKVTPDDLFRHLTIAAPYLELIEEFTLEEMLRFHFSFKQPLPGLTIKTIVERLGISAGKNKTIRNFSSGMKQRVKLALALQSRADMILLDEPTVNLDTEGIEWYLRMLREFSQGRTIIICSNLHETEAAFATKILRIEDYKNQG